MHFYRAIVFFLALWPTLAVAQEVAPPTAPDSKGPQPPFTAWNGSFTHTIALDVPDFRGLGPSLSLTYNSSRGTRGLQSPGGELGIGWSLTGISTIDRISGSPTQPLDLNQVPTKDKTSSGKGVPSYGFQGMPPDSYSLDGNELIPCTEIVNTSTTPSCAVPVAPGSTGYTARIENFVRIRHIPPENRWEVTARDGTISLYSSQEGVSFAQTYRWHLQKTTDLHGNSVQYDWTCDTLLECHLTKIRYVNVSSTSSSDEIRLYFEERPDHTSFGTGRDTRPVTKRLKTVASFTASDATQTLQPVKAYNLSYDQSLSTGQSRVISIQQYGLVNTGTVSETGDILGGMAHPAVLLQYDSSIFGVTAAAWPRSVSGKQEVQGTVSVADFNGDGRNDITALHVYSHQGGGGGDTVTEIMQRFWMSSGTSFVQLSDFDFGGMRDSRQALGFGDVDGNGRDEFVYSRTETANNNLQTTNRYYYKYNPTNNVSSALILTGEPDAVNGSLNISNGFLSGDFDGDGRTDYYSVDNNWIFKATVTGFHVFPVTSSLRVFPSQGSVAKRLLTGDFNGDGRTDFTRYWTDDDLSVVQIFLSTGSSFILSSQQTLTWNSPEGWVAADVNGDGLSDIVAAKPASSSYATMTLVSNGNAVVLNGAQPVLLGGFGISDTFGTLRAVQANGDNQADLLLYDKQTGFYRIAKSTGSGFALDPTTIHKDLVRTIGDFSGDGLTDFYEANAAGAMRISAGWQGNLLTSIRTETGGVISPQYVSSTSSAETFLPFVMPLVKSITIDDGRTVAATTDFSYVGGEWNAVERQFMGFRTVTSELPANSGETTRPVVKTTYQQSAACFGRVSLVERQDAGGVLLETTVSGYTTDSSAPHVCNNSTNEHWIHDQDGVRKSKVNSYFSMWGNVGRVFDSGNLDVLGDESTTWHSYAVNPDAFITNCKSQRHARPGNNDGTQPFIALARYYSDENLSHTDLPIRCDLRVERSYDKSTTYSDRSFAYDSYGNVIEEQDGAGNTTRHFYDAVSHRHEIETWLPPANRAINPDPAFKILTAWHQACGQPLSVTDINGQVTSFTYDALCRKTLESRPGGDSTVTEYVNFDLPAPSQQYVHTKRRAPSAAATTIWSRDYLDGFGRTWLTYAEGASATKHVKVQTRYTPRGEVEAVSAPYFNDGTDTPVWTTYGYDALDRLIKVTQPDGAFSTLTHGLGAATATDMALVTATDELGNNQSFGLDAAGKLTRRIKYKSGDAPLVTEYRRDLLGRIVTVVDPRLNQWDYSYDWLGRRTAVHDPDLGNWSYVYDAASRLTSQTDARMIVTALTYDELSRVKSKTVSGPGISPETTLNSYDDSTGNGHAGFFNRGKLTDATRSLGAVSLTRRFDHDAAGRLARERHIGVAGQDRTLSFDYWPNGQLKRKQLADGSWTGDHVYDAAGRLFSIGNAATASASEPEDFITSASYDARGQTETIAYGNGAATSFTYDPARGWLTRVLTTKAGAPLSDLSYARNARGMITAVTSQTGIAGFDGPRSWSYGYDALGRLVSADRAAGTAEDRAYAYDDADNLIWNSGLCAGSASSPNMAYPAQGPASVRPHAPTSICGSPVSYDANGNTLGYDSDGAGAGSPRSLAWDGENRPIAITRNGNVATFSYGPDGERASKAFLGDTRLFLGTDAELLVNAANPTGLLTSHLHADVKREGAVTSWSHKDHLASSRRVSFMGAAPASIHDYGPFGQPLTVNGSTVINGKAYINERFDP